MKINLISAFMRGDEIFTANIATPSAKVVYYKLVAINNRLGWNTFVIETTLKSLSLAAQLRPYETRLALEKLIDLQLIMYRNDIDLTSTQHRLDIVLLPRDRDIKTLRSLLNESFNQSMTDRQTDMQTDKSCSLSVSTNNQSTDDIVGEGKEDDVIKRRVQIYENYKITKGEELVMKTLKQLSDEGIFFPTSEVFVRHLEHLQRTEKIVKKLNE